MTRKTFDTQHHVHAKIRMTQRWARKCSSKLTPVRFPWWRIASSRRRRRRARTAAASIGRWADVGSGIARRSAPPSPAPPELVVITHRRETHAGSNSALPGGNEGFPIRRATRCSIGNPSPKFGEGIPNCKNSQFLFEPLTKIW